MRPCQLINEALYTGTVQCDRGDRTVYAYGWTEADDGLKRMWLRCDIK